MGKRRNSGTTSFPMLDNRPWRSLPIRAPPAAPIRGTLKCTSATSRRFFFPGRNNVGNTAQTLASVKSLLSSINPSTPCIVIGVLAATGEDWSSSNRQSIEDCNRQVAALVGGAFLDPNDIMCVNDDGSIRLDGTPNPNYLSDGLHPNPAGYQRLANSLKDRITAERWYS